jgi:hypothetical protein
MRLTESTLRKIIKEEIQKIKESRSKFYENSDIAKEVVSVIIDKHRGRIYGVPSGEIENEIFQYLENAGLSDADLYDAAERAQKEL